MLAEYNLGIVVSVVGETMHHGFCFVFLYRYEA